MATSYSNRREWTWTELFLTDLWLEPLNARSRTCDRLGHVDIAMIIPPIRAFVWFSVCPYLACPISAINLFGYWRCIRTTETPKVRRKDKYDSRVYYGVQKRTYDVRAKKLIEDQVASPSEINHALDVVGDIRNQFIDDPNKPGTAYFVVEQKIMRQEAMFLTDNWAWALTADMMRYLSPIMIAIMFVQPVKRMTVDINLCLQRRLNWRQIRHPIANFFTTYNEFHVNKHRVNVLKPQSGTKAPYSPLNPAPGASKFNPASMQFPQR